MPNPPTSVDNGQLVQSLAPDNKGLAPVYSDRDLLKSLVLGNPNILVAPPQLKVTNGVAFTRRQQGVITRTIQNNGIVPIFWTCSDDIPSIYDAATPFHGIIPPGSAADDGFGAVLDVSRYINPIIIWTRTGTLRASLFAAYDRNVMFGSHGSNYIFAS